MNSVVPRQCSESSIPLEIVNHASILSESTTSKWIAVVETNVNFGIEYVRVSILRFGTPSNQKSLRSRPTRIIIFLANDYQIWANIILFLVSSSIKLWKKPFFTPSVTHRLSSEQKSFPTDHQLTLHPIYSISEDIPLAGILCEDYCPGKGIGILFWIKIVLSS